MTQILDAKAKPAAGRLPAGASAVARAIAGQRLFLCVVAVYCAAGAAFAAALGESGSFSLSLYSGTWALMLAAYLGGYLLVVLPLRVILLDRPASPVAALVGRWRAELLNRERLLQALPVLLVLPLVISAFTSLKTLIPVANPYEWDPAFAALDRWLHGGVDPWALLHPLLGFPAATVAVNAAYNAWFFVMAGVTLWQVFQTRDPRTRTQYLVTLVLLWALLGNVLATVFASVGPCFYGALLGGPDPFAPLMAYLRQTELDYPIWAVATQDMLWRAYAEGGLRLGSGISAMPSLHVATAVLLALAGFRRARWLGWALAAFAAAILVGSVHLGWHYAIDGYAALLATPVVWAAVGWLLDRRPGLVGGP